jgi:hypothetical protein
MYGGSIGSIVTSSLRASEFLVAESISKETPHFLTLNAGTGFLQFKSKD